MSKKFIIILVVTMIMILSGCSEKPTEPQKQAQNIKLYFADTGNEDFLIEERQISYEHEEEKYQRALEQLIKGPEKQTARSNIAKETKVYGTIKQKEDLIVSLSREFNQFGGSVAEILGVGSVVNTMTQFPEIKRVKILVEGEELLGPSGQPRGFMEPFIKEPGAVNTMNVILYFGNADASAVKGERRTITLVDKEDQSALIQSILQELIKGPTETGLHRTIPQETQILNVRIKDTTAILDFSTEMESKHWGGAAGESMTVNSIVNTLTEFDFIHDVLMTVQGKPMNIEHMIVDEPIKRNESMIQK